MEQLLKLNFLLNIGQRILDERLPFGWMAECFDCGTYACWGGYYSRFYGGERIQLMQEFADHFSITDRQVVSLFSPYGGGRDLSEESYTELERRMKILDELILEKYPKHQDLPVSVPEAFDQPSACAV